MIVDSRKKIVLWGAGQIAEVTYLNIVRDGRYEVAGFCMDRNYIDKNSFYGKPVVPYEDIEQYYPQDEYSLLFIIGYKDNNKLREEKYLEGKRRGYSFASYICKDASVNAKSIGENVIIFEKCVVQDMSVIGNNTIVWSGSFIGHHSLVGDNCFLGPNSCVCGSSAIGRNTFIGANATIKDNISIGDFNVIGAGVTLRNNTKEGQLFR